jgi:hypothetical protein
MRFHLMSAAAMTGLAVFSVAASAVDPFETLSAIPAPPANVAAAGAATRVGTAAGSASFTAPAYDSVEARINDSLKSQSAAAMGGSAGGIDFARASSDPAYAAQIQARMQNMSTEERMAMANQMRASQMASMGDPRTAGVVAGFLGGQRNADIAAQQKMRAVLDEALKNTGTKHRAVDDALAAAAKACATDKTGWPLASCTGPLGMKSLEQHRAVEEGSLGAEARALAQANAIAQAELNKGRDLFSHANATPNPSLLAWAMVYVQMLNDYARAITLRAGFWAHADSSKYTGQVNDYIGSQAGEIYWPLKGAGYSELTTIGL